MKSVAQQICQHFRSNQANVYNGYIKKLTDYTTKPHKLQYDGHLSMDAAYATYIKSGVMYYLPTKLAMVWDNVDLKTLAAGLKRVVEKGKFVK